MISSFPTVGQLRRLTDGPIVIGLDGLLDQGAPRMPVECRAMQEMRVGPSEPVCRGGGCRENPSFDAHICIMKSNSVRSSSESFA
jgi:hypothetical protein